MGDGASRRPWLRRALRRPAARHVRGGSNHSYEVRAIFDDAANVISGEEVKIDGAKVGTVGSVTATPQAKAAVVLNIENTGFQDFRIDASCTIRPQALIGEKYVDCLPTQPRVEGTPLPPPLPKIRTARRRRAVPAAGAEHQQPRRRRPARRHQPPARTPAPDADHQRIRRRPGGARQRPERRHQARQPGTAGTRPGARDPRQREPRARQTRRRLRPGARAAGEGARATFADFFAQSNTVAQASAAHARRPQEPRAVPAVPAGSSGPSMERLGRFADQTTPTSPTSDIAAPAINQAFEELPASQSGSRRSSRASARTARRTGPRSSPPSRC